MIISYIILILQVFFLKMPTVFPLVGDIGAAKTEENRQSPHAATKAKRSWTMAMRSKASAGSIPFTSNSNLTVRPPSEKVMRSASDFMTKMPSPAGWSSEGSCPKR